MPAQPQNLDRDLLNGSINVLVLAVLADGRQYGYGIRKQLTQFTGQAVAYARLYPLLHTLESQGLVTAEPDPASARKRKWYTLTEAGQRVLIKSATQWQAAIARQQSIVLPAVRRLATKTET